MADAAVGWAVGVWGTRISTRDGGVTWSDHSVPVTLDHALFAWLSTEDQAKVRESGEVYQDVVLIDVFCRPRPGEMCWIVGEFGAIFRSEDLGATWLRASIDRDTSDSGRTWAEPTVGDIPATVCFLRVLDFDAAGEVGYTLGQD